MKIEFKTENEAFDDFGASEIRRILEKIADDVELGQIRGVIMDIYGNKIGRWMLED